MTNNIKIKVAKMKKVKNESFSVKDGIEIQTEQLKDWKKVLQPKVYKSLVKFATKDNSKAKTGYDICRGTDFTNYIENYVDKEISSSKYELINK